MRHFSRSDAHEVFLNIFIILRFLPDDLEAYTKVLFDLFNKVLRTFNPAANIAVAEVQVGLPSTRGYQHHTDAAQQAFYSVPFPNADTTQARRFLDILTHSGRVTFQTFSDREELKVKLPSGKVRNLNARILHGILEQHIGVLTHLNHQGAGVFVMVNEGDGKGRTAKNVTRVRAVFIDTDGALYPTDLPLKPHLIVESSPGKYHLYWLVDGLTLSDFAPLQKALAEHYGTDPSVHDLPRVMRLPGFYHRKGEPVRVRLLEAHDHAPFGPADVFEAWPFLLGRLERERQAEAEEEQHRAEHLKQAAARRANPPNDADRDRRRALAILATHHDRVVNARSGTRHKTLKESAYTLGGYVGGGYLESSEVEDVLQAAASVCGLPDAEAADVIRWGLAKGRERPLELSSDGTTIKQGIPPSGKRQSRRQRLMGWYA